MERSRKRERLIELDGDRGIGREEERRRDTYIYTWGEGVRGGANGEQGYPSDGLVISYGSAVTRGAFPSVDLFALPILTSPKSLYPPSPGNTK